MKNKHMKKKKNDNNTALKKHKKRRKNNKIKQKQNISTLKNTPNFIQCEHVLQQL